MTRASIVLQQRSNIIFSMLTNILLRLMKWNKTGNLAYWLSIKCKYTEGVDSISIFAFN